MSTQPLKDENYYEAELQANLQRAEWAEESRLNNEAIARDLEEARADTYEDEPENNVAAKNDDDVLPVTVDPTTQDIVVTDGDTEYRISEKETEEALEEELPNSLFPMKNTLL